MILFLVGFTKRGWGGVIKVWLSGGQTNVDHFLFVSIFNLSI